jgi:S1-C subfamily serine protease
MPNSKLIEEVLKPVVRVNHDGSGSLVYSKNGLTLVLTNAHVLKECVVDEDRLDETPFIDVDRFTYKDTGELIGFYRVQAEIIAFDGANDLAMLRLRDSSQELNIALLPTALEAKKISVFDEVFAVGCAYGDQPKPTTGIISSLNTEYMNKSFWMTTAPIVFGNSGGACFRKDAKGHYKLIGVPTAVLATVIEGADGKTQAPKEPVPHINYLVPAHGMLAFIKHVIKVVEA